MIYSLKLFLKEQNVLKEMNSLFLPSDWFYNGFHNLLKDLIMPAIALQVVEVHLLLPINYPQSNRTKLLGQLGEQSFFFCG